MMDLRICFHQPNTVDEVSHQCGVFQDRAEKPRPSILMLATSEQGNWRAIRLALQRFRFALRIGRILLGPLR